MSDTNDSIGNVLQLGKNVGENQSRDVDSKGEGEREKEQEKFGIAMTKAIEAFQGAQGFADLAQKLNLVCELIKNNKPSDGKYTTEYRIPAKQKLAKVLALSLNPACSDSHGKSLEVYAAVFEREKVSCI
jgi:hypothetical protein